MALTHSSPSTALVSVAVVIITAQLLGALAQRWHQPRVVGEIIAGIVLGPSLLGALAPALENQLFSEAVRSQLALLGQLGLVLFMFLIGLELNPKMLQGRIPLASRITVVGVLLPLGLGMLLARGFELWQPQLLPGNQAIAGALFMGCAMAITAFPVLARILRERQLLSQPLGALAITAAALQDVLSWVLLAVVVAFARSSSWAGSLLPLLGTTAWSLLLLFGLRPLRRRLQESYRRSHQLGPLLQASLFAGALLSAAVTEWMGVHAIFGAFLWGLAMPRYGPMRRRLEQRLEAVVLQLLLPLFFVISGLNTSIGSINTLPLLLTALLVLAVAVGGKFIGTWATAKLSGVTNLEAQALGWLMNTRGLTELVILNVGLDLGVISTELFTIGVVMALATTVMTGPLLDRLGFTI